MSEINYKTLENYLSEVGKESNKNGFAQVYLIYGEELLYKTALEELLGKMIPDAERSLHYEPIDGLNENIPEAIERANTFSFLPSTKVVALLDSRIFYTKETESLLLEKAKEAHDKNDFKMAAKYFLSVLGFLNLAFDDLGNENRIKTLKLDPEKTGDDKWIDNIINYCKDNNLPITTGRDSSRVLESSIKKGFPKGNHLIITTDMVDKRQKLFKTIKDSGIIIDCSVPKGERRADRIVQEAVLNERMRAILAKSGKVLGKDAYSALFEMTGFDLRTFSNNLEKLISYTGNRDKITVDDVVSVLERTKKDPIFEFTNSISDRNCESALFYLNSLLSDNFHPLQMLAAITNTIRRLLLAKNFTESPFGSVWHAGCQYNTFQRNVLPRLLDHDRILLDRLEEWEKMLSKSVETDNEKPKQKKSKKKSKSDTDLTIVKNPNNPYPIYQLLKKSEKFTREDLLASLECLNDADIRIKSTSLNPKLILDEVIFNICLTP